ncbi:MAG TPA: DMT family transporter [Bryobacteraceae bacterium]|nr:DMT family transporter [Bryobacteraceae bacterium]
MEFARNGILMAITAQGLIGVSLLWDKILLRKPATQNLVSYVFWMGAISIFGVILAFFGFHMPPPGIALLAFGAGALQLAGIYFYYEALKRGEASEALAVMGGFSPVATALIGWGLLGSAFSRGSLLGFLLMVAGGFVMFLAERLDVPKLLAPVLLASGIYGLVNVTEKIAFNHANFVTAYVFFTLGTFAGSMLLLVRPSWRRQIFENTGGAEPKSKELYFINRFVNGLGSFLVYYAISLASPAMVDAVSAVRYVVIFLGAYLITTWKPRWLQEDFHGVVLIGKAAATLLVAAGLALASLHQHHPAHAARSALLQREQTHAGRHQARSQPALPVHIFLQDEFGQNRFEQVAGGGGRNREAELRDGEQREKREEGYRHRGDTSQHVNVAGEGTQETAQSRGAEMADVPVLAHAEGIEHVPHGVAEYDDQDQQPPHGCSS